MMLESEVISNDQERQQTSMESGDIKIFLPLLGLKLTAL